MNDLERARAKAFEDSGHRARAAEAASKAEADWIDSLVKAHIPYWAAIVSSLVNAGYRELHFEWTTYPRFMRGLGYTWKMPRLYGDKLPVSLDFMDEHFIKNVVCAHYGVRVKQYAAKISELLGAPFYLSWIGGGGCLYLAPRVSHG